MEDKGKSISVFLAAKFKLKQYICNICDFCKFSVFSKNIFISRCWFSYLLKWSVGTRLRQMPSAPQVRFWKRCQVRRTFDCDG